MLSMLPVHRCVRLLLPQQLDGDSKTLHVTSVKS
jgi:hypothetical protein